MATFTASTAAANAPVRYMPYGVNVSTGRYSFTTVPSAGDVYMLCKVPAGAVILEMVGSFISGGNNGNFAIGDTLSDNRHGTSVLTTTMLFRIGGINGIQYSYSAETTINMTFSTVTSASAAGSLRLSVFYTNGNQQD